MYKYKLCSTYGYLCTSISSVVPTGYLHTSISFVTPTGDLNKYKSTISTSKSISLLYEYMNNYDICYYISVTVISLLYMSISSCVYV